MLLRGRIGFSGIQDSSVDGTCSHEEHNQTHDYLEQSHFCRFLPVAQLLIDYDQGDKTRNKSLRVTLLVECGTLQYFCLGNCAQIKLFIPTERVLKSSCVRSTELLKLVDEHERSLPHFSLPLGLFSLNLLN